MKELLNCVCCNSTNLRLILDLGAQSPANNYNVVDKYPLRLNVCLDCSHAQLSHAVNPDILFKDYPYMSGVSKTMLEYYDKFASEISKWFPFTFLETVLDIACNDGSQLDSFKKLGYNTTGVDPAENICKIAEKKGHKIYNEYYKGLEQYFDILIAQNVLAHTDDPFDFLLSCKTNMRAESILVIQTSQANMIKNHQFDTIYHEHISFFNKRSIGRLFDRVGFEVMKYWQEDIHGGSDIYILRKMPEISITDYSDFSNRCYKFAKEFNKMVKELQKDNYIVCYGAAAKMINLIRFTDINPDFIIDDTPTKKNKTICGLKVDSFEDLKRITSLGKPLVIIPVWNFSAEIKEKCGTDYKYLDYTPEIKLS